VIKKPDRTGIHTNMTPSFPEVAVLGAAAVDWVARLEAMPSVDGIAFADQYTCFPGGSGGNVAEGLARLGHPVRFLGVLGDDEGGRLLMKAFESAGVDTSCIRVEKGQRSAACFIAVDRHGQRMIFALGGVAVYDRVADITACQLAGVKILYIADAYQEVAQAAISLLEPGARVVFSPGGLMTASGLQGLLPILECTDVLIVSRVEAEALTGNSDPQQACQVLAGTGPQSVVLTLGERGALVFDKQGSFLVPAGPVEQVVDTTGAGDAFSAGLITGLLEGLPLEQAVRLGGLVAAHKIQHFGSRNGLPDRMQINF
jgi:sugar/nucleoside kinase (ribokinase family)